MRLGKIVENCKIPLILCNRFLVLLEALFYNLLIFEHVAETQYRYGVLQSIQIENAVKENRLHA